MHKYDPLKFKKYMDMWYALNDKDSDYAFDIFWKAVCCAPIEFVETLHMLMLKDEADRAGT